MSIAGWLPPMIDPSDEHLLVDGAYINNVPGITLRRLWLETPRVSDFFSVKPSLPGSV
jgi:predicted acylesterase/phospholipase RssA